ncbi:MAG: 4-(cytidine 5'-diphospho)-2-C-methyl-D-erythritol kinase [Planctomycetes bacterium]|nr:4-(cytidine 5'-diphospho)-2-C-methyl-D-erythritol kinase [Planctomycetota bacterium]
MITLQAPAKLNLSLAVLARRPDGFHEIESLMVPVTLHDTLALRAIPEPDVRLAVRFGGRLARPEAASLRRDVPADESNLVVRAARLLAAEAGETRGLEINLVKEIPSGAGLGGGSSDAAAALVGAAQAWGIDWPRKRLANLAARLGSDVPFFLVGGPAIASGRGEELVPVAGIPPLAAVIACPAAGLSTAAVYAKCAPDGSRRGLAQRLAAALAGGNFREALDTMHNDLEPPARALSTDVVRLLEAFAEAGAFRPLLTGSGSACFALARTAAEARGIAARLEAAGWPGVFAVQLATAHT